MGTLAREAITEAAGIQYVGGFARSRVPELYVDDDFDRLLHERRPDVLLDFTPRPVTQMLARSAVEHEVAVVVGSSEWDHDERKTLDAVARERGVGALVVPNFAIGAVLMMRFAEQAAKYFPTAEVVELHRQEKRDKPSGTARTTAERIRAGGGPHDVPIHSVRLRGLLAHQEVLFGNSGELLTIRHDSLSRESFANGILFAIRNVRSLKGVEYGLDAILT